MPENYFYEITQQFVDAGLAQVGNMGNAHSTLLPALEFVQFAIQKMEQEFGL